MHPCTATALRRTAILAAALMASLTAHAVSEGHLALMTQAPLIWLGMLAMAVPCGAVRPVTEFRARSPILILGILIVAQTAMHIAMSEVPWAFGLQPHHAAGLTAGALLAHGLAAALLAVLLAAGDRLLAAAVAAGRAIVTALAPPKRSNGTHPGYLVPCAACAPAPHPLTRCGASRAPPR
ncbi:MAG: hypothetical protein U0237_11690 [Thermoleophilia bacterium]